MSGEVSRLSRHKRSKRFVLISQRTRSRNSSDVLKYSPFFSSLFSSAASDNPLSFSCNHSHFTLQSHLQCLSHSKHPPSKSLVPVCSLSTTRLFDMADLWYKVEKVDLSASYDKAAKLDLEVAAVPAKKQKKNLLGEGFVRKYVGGASLSLLSHPCCVLTTCTQTWTTSSRTKMVSHFSQRYLLAHVLIDLAYRTTLERIWQPFRTLPHQVPPDLAGLQVCCPFSMTYLSEHN